MGRCPVSKSSPMQNYYIRVYGPLACFTLPYGPERTSSLIPSHDAAESILKAIYGPWEVGYRVEEVQLLTMPTRHNMVLNEVHTQAINPKRPTPVLVDEKRTQRTTTFLRNVDYVFKAYPYLSGYGSHSTNMPKIHKLFRERITKGQHYRQPYMGMRECTAYVELLDKAPLPVQFNADLGLHYYGFDFTSRTPYFTQLQICNGIAKLPSWEEVKSNGFRGVSRGISK